MNSKASASEFHQYRFFKNNLPTSSKPWLLISSQISVRVNVMLKRSRMLIKSTRKVKYVLKLVQVHFAVPSLFFRSTYIKISSYTHFWTLFIANTFQQSDGFCTKKQTKGSAQIQNSDMFKNLVMLIERMLLNIQRCKDLNDYHVG